MFPGFSRSRQPRLHARRVPVIKKSEGVTISGRHASDEQLVRTDHNRLRRRGTRLIRMTLALGRRLQRFSAAR